MSPSPPTTGAAYLPTSQVWHVARRLTGGASPALVSEIAATGVTAWIDTQLNPASIDDHTYDAIAARFGSQTESIASVKSKIDSGALEGWQRKFSVQCEHVARLCWSKRQLQALMTDFWANHMNVAVMSDGVDESRAHYQATIRTLAFARFTDLLVALSKHPAMLTFLDNRSSRREHPNENQGRELLELHSLGVGSYLEAMVSSSSRVLTGETVDNKTGVWQYQPSYHATGAVRVLGWRHPNSSQAAGDGTATVMLRYLARQPATARRLCTKLAQYFVSETPPPALVDRMVATYLAGDTAIAPVLRLMLTSAEFVASIGAVTRRPLESTVATVRVLGLGPDKTGYDGVKALVWQLEQAGQPPMNWPTPDGFRMASAAWGSTNAVLTRWNSNRNIVNGWWPDTLTRTPTLLAWVHPGALPATHGQFVDDVAVRLFGRTMTADHSAAALTFVNATADKALTSTSPIVTWRLGDLVTLLLDSPYHAYR
ncbi:MAG: DUF1800 domain-containing protein [Actinomycetales bacterium]